MVIFYYHAIINDEGMVVRGSFDSCLPSNICPLWCFLSTFSKFSMRFANFRGVLLSPVFALPYPYAFLAAALWHQRVAFCDVTFPAHLRRKRRSHLLVMKTPVSLILVTFVLTPMSARCSPVQCELSFN